MKKDDKKENKELKFVEPEVKPFLHESHKLPKTRREFIAHGFIGISASVVLPSFASMLVTQNSAFAASAACELPTFQGGLPYICIDVGGRMNIAGSNAMVGIVDGGEHQEDVSPVGYSSSDYIRLGITPSEHPSQPGRLEGKYGLKFHRASGIL